MKKLILLAATVFTGMTAMAQVTYFEGSLKEAIAKAKAENKMVFIKGSTTWCGPCKYLASQVLTTPEAGEYFNSRFVFKSYELDVADTDKIAETYGIKAYPTMIVLNGDGEEVGRIVGGARDAKSFIDRVEEALKNPMSKVKAAYEANPENLEAAELYMGKLFEANQNAEGLKILQSIFPKRTPEQNFTQESLNLYFSLLNDFNDPILKYMLENRAKVAAIITDDMFNRFFEAKLGNTVFNSINKPEAEKTFNEVQDVMKKYSINSALASMVLDQKDIFLKKDVAKLNQWLISNVESKKIEDPNMKAGLLNLFASIAKAQNPDTYKDIMNPIGDKLNELETNMQMKGNFDYKSVIK